MPASAATTPAATSARLIQRRRLTRTSSSAQRGQAGPITGSRHQPQRGADATCSRSVDSPAGRQGGRHGELQRPAHVQLPCEAAVEAAGDGARPPPGVQPLVRPPAAGAAERRQAGATPGPAPRSSASAGRAGRPRRDASGHRRAPMRNGAEAARDAAGPAAGGGRTPSSSCGAPPRRPGSRSRAAPIRRAAARPADRLEVAGADPDRRQMDDLQLRFGRSGGGMRERRHRRCAGHPAPARPRAGRRPAAQAGRRPRGRRWRP